MSKRRTYNDLPLETRKAMKAPDPKPEPRYAESFLKEAYAMKLLAERTTDKEEKKWARQREKELLASAQKAPLYPKATDGPADPASPSKRSSTRSRIGSTSRRSRSSS